jgi:hypothetical protein
LATDPPAGLWDKYLRETPQTTQVAATAEKWVEELRGEAQQVLDAGPLAPVRTVYADLEQDPYFLIKDGCSSIFARRWAGTWPKRSRFPCFNGTRKA